MDDLTYRENKNPFSPNLRSSLALIVSTYPCFEGKFSVPIAICCERADRERICARDSRSCQKKNEVESFS